ASIGQAFFVAVLALVATSILTDCSGTDSEPKASSSQQRRKHGLTREQANQVLVRVDGKAITVGEFAELLADQSPYLRARYSSPERRREFLENLVRFKLLAAEARRKGYDRLPDVQQTRKQLMIQQLLDTELREHVRLSAISDKAIEQYYRAHFLDFH